MHWIKRSMGIVLSLFGIVGVLACAVGIIEVWSIRGRVDESVVRVSDRVDDILGRVHERAEVAADRITSSRESLNELNERVQLRVAELRDVPDTEAADIDGIERQFYARIDRLRDLIGFMQSSTDLLEQIFSMVESSAAFLKRDTHSMEDLVSGVRAGHDEVEQATLLFDELNDHLVEIKAKRNIDEHAKSFTSLYSRIDASLGKVQKHATSFEAKVSQLRKDLAEDLRQIRRWLYIAAGIATLVLIWISVAQISLAIHGWKLVRAPHRRLRFRVAIREHDEPNNEKENV